MSKIRSINPQGHGGDKQGNYSEASVVLLNLQKQFVPAIPGWNLGTKHPLFCGLEQGF